LNSVPKLFVAQGTQKLRGGCLEHSKHFLALLRVTARRREAGVL
jgi:hypothetical protein